jgi:hypothetical protein
MRPAPQLPPQLPPLRAGERLTQTEFHRRYQPHPEKEKFELIGGVVHMASPLGESHGSSHSELAGAFVTYRAATPGTRTADNATSILGMRSEVQPDLLLRILPEYGGQAVVEGGYIHGAPELIAEIADSSETVDLGVRRTDYQAAGVCEYLVVCLQQRQVRWFDFRRGNEIRATRQGVHRSRIFPGLWIDGAALLDGNASRLLAVVQQGIASTAHARFVQRVERERRRCRAGEAGRRERQQQRDLGAGHGRASRFGCGVTAQL